jgi:ubiquinone/menaquinone biosynthesis C-methylase UbiE
MPPRYRKWLGVRIDGSCLLQSLTDVRLAFRGGEKANISKSRMDEAQQMSFTQSRDQWASSKQISPDRLAELKAALAQHIDAAFQAIRSAARDATFASNFQFFYAAVDTLAAASRALANFSHMIKSECDWGPPPMPEFQDQFVNQYFNLPKYRRTFWLEGAVFCGLGIEPGKRILELCCGTGWYTDLFYSPFASEIVAVDFDPRAIETAQRFHQRSNIKYQVMDIREAFPDGPFASVIWDGAIEHFTMEEIDSIMQRMQAVMTPGARLVGYTVAESANAPQLPTHETHFQGIEHLGGVLKRYFKSVRVFERLHSTISPPRHNLFFYASDGPLPFDQEWQHGLRL